MIITGFLALLLSNAQAQTTISPLRAVITPTQSEAIFEVTNPSLETVAVSLDWSDLVALADGRYRPALDQERADISAAPYLTLSPARFMLAPGEKKSIKVAATPGKTLSFVHEKRSHLIVRSKPAHQQVKKVSGLPLSLSVAVSVPIIVRSGTPQTRASIDRVWLERKQDGGLALMMDLKRQGEGTIVTGFTAALTKDFVQPWTIASGNNIALYPELETRHVSMPLGTTALPGGEVEIRLYKEEGERDILISRRLFKLQAPSGGPQPKMLRVETRWQPNR